MRKLKRVEQLILLIVLVLPLFFSSSMYSINSTNSSSDNQTNEQTNLNNTNQTAPNGIIFNKTDFIINQTINCDECSNNLVPSETTVNVSISLDSPNYTSNDSLFEYINKDWDLINIYGATQINQANLYILSWPVIKNYSNFFFTANSPKSNKSYNFTTKYGNKTQTKIINLFLKEGNSSNLNNNATSNISSVVSNETTNSTTELNTTGNVAGYFNETNNSTTELNTTGNVTGYFNETNNSTTGLNTTINETNNSNETTNSTTKLNTTGNVTDNFNETINSTLNFNTIPNVTEILNEANNSRLINNSMILSLFNENLSNTTANQSVIKGILLFREAPSGVGTNQRLEINYYILNNGNSTAKELFLTENIPSDWTTESLYFNKTNIIIPIYNLSKNQVQHFNYTLTSPSEEKNYSFTTKIKVANISQERTIEVSSSKAFFDTKIDLSLWSEGINRVIHNNTQYKARITIANIGNINVSSKRVYYYWGYNDSIWNISDVSAQGCNKLPINYLGKKAIKCIWTEFKAGETKNIDFKITSPESNKFEYTFSKTIYDPFKDSGFYKSIQFLFNSYKHLFQLIYNSIHSFFTGSPTGYAVANNPKRIPSKNNETEKDNSVPQTIKEIPKTKVNDNLTKENSSIVIPSKKNETVINKTENITKTTNLIKKDTISPRIRRTKRTFKEPTIFGSVYPRTISAGENTTYTLTIVNNNQNELNNVLINNINLPNEFEGFSCSETGKSYCQIDRINKNQEGKAEFIIHTNNKTSAKEYNLHADVKFDFQGNAKEYNNVASANVFIGNAIYISNKEHFISVSNTSSLTSSPIKIVGSDNQTKSVIMKVKKGNSFESINNLNEISNCSDCEIQLEFKTKSIKKIVLNGFKFKNKTLNLRYDEVPSSKVKVGSEIVMKSFAFDPSDLNFTNGKITTTALGNQLWKCKDWDFVNQKCTGSWNKLMDIKPGKEYNISIDMKDPGFKETGVVSINTKKPIYHPNETAEISIVVLDKQGYLARNAQVEVKITTPDSKEYSYSNQDYSLVETSKGIYRLSFPHTNKEGNYSIIAIAVGPNVEQNMSTYFTVKSFYEFDIIRNTPITIDPWKGSFKSEITIISYSYKGRFNFTELIPLDYNITQNGGAVISQDSNNKFLKWNNLKNNTTISYFVQAPLVSPDLRSFGKAFVNYGNETFTEARPWYIAVDPSESSSLILFWDNETTDVPNANWECISCSSGDDFYERFPKGAASYGNTGGHKTHSHNLTLDTSSGPSTLTAYRTAGANIDVPSSTHTHTLAKQFVANASSMPPYRSLKIIRYKYGIPTHLPKGVIAIFNSTPPSGWTPYNVQNGFFILGNSSISTGGSSTHSHFVNVTTGQSIGTARVRSGSDPIPSLSHTHEATGYTNEGNNTPPFIKVILAKADSDTGIPDGDNGLIALFNGTAPSNWNNVSSVGKPFNSRFLLADSNYGEQGGYEEHNHENFNIDTTGPSATSNIAQFRSGGNFASVTHTHTLTLSSDNATNLPPYINVVIAYARDTSPPTIALKTPIQDSYSLSTVEFNFTVNDTTGISNCTLIVDGKYNQSNTSAIINNGLNSISSVLSEGTHTWTVNCTDIYGLEATNSSTRTINIDETGPTIDLSTLNKNNSYHNESTYIFYFNVSDEESLGECNLYFSGFLTDTLTTPSKINTNNFTETSLGEGPYYWQIKCADALSNMGSSENRVMTVDVTKPKVSLRLPKNNAYFNYSTGFFFNYTPLDSHLDSCWLMINLTSSFSKNKTNHSPVNNIENTFEGLNLNESTYIWNVYCNDSAGNIGYNNTNFTFTIDLTPPIASFILPTPVNNANTSQTTLTINVSHTETNPDTIILNFAGNEYSKNYINSYTNFTVSGLTDGIKEYFVWLNDSAGNSYQTETNNITIDTKGPSINLTNPGNDTWSNINNIYFNFTASDELLNIKNCSLIVNDSVKDVKSFASSSILSYLNTSLSSGNYNWYINCSDQVGNENQSQTRVLKVDLETPNINNENINGTSFLINEYICLEVNVTDVLSGIYDVKAQILMPGSGWNNVSLNNSPDNCGNAGGSIYAKRLKLSEEGVYNWTKTFAHDNATNLQTHPVSNLYWNVVASNTMNISLDSPTSDININESESNNIFNVNCTINCTQGSCEDIIVKPQYQQATEWSDITTSSNYLTSNVNSKSCGNISAPGGFCKVNYTITARPDSGGNALPFRCFASSSTAPDASTNSITVNINDHPHAQFAYPTNLDWLHGTEILNGSSSNDDVNISAYEFFLDNSSNFISPVTLCSGSIATCSFNTETQNRCSEENTDCYIKLTVTDNQGLTNSSILQIGIDNTKPNVNIATPSNFTNITTSLIDVNISSSDSGAGINNVTVYYKNDSSLTWILLCSDNISPYSCQWDLSSLENLQYYELKAIAYDNENNYNQDFVFNLTYDNKAPTINLNKPTQNNFTNENITFSYYANDNLIGINNCSLFFDSSLNQTNSTISEQSLNYFNLIGVSEGTHSWYVSCYDKLGNNNVSTTRTVNVDTTGPITTLDEQKDYTNLSQGLYTINATADDGSGVGINSISFYYKENSSDSWHFICSDSTPSPYGCLWNTSSLNEGTNYQIGAKANDSLGNYGDFDIHYNITIDKTPPSIYAVSPENDSQDVDGNVDFTFNVDDNLLPLLNCTLFINNTENESDTSISSGQNTINSNLTNGDYTWYVTCWDMALNHNSTAPRNIKISPDTDPPTIHLISPKNDTTDTDGDVTFYYNVTDSLSSISNCSLIINGSINRTTQSPIENQKISFNIPSINEGDYSWQIQCTDNAATPNSNTTSKRYFSVILATNINVSISLDKSIYQKGEIANITVNSTDELGNPLNTSVSTDIIKGNTSLPWWNTIWTNRKQILLSTTKTTDQNNIIIFANITGLENNISNCTKEIRIISNRTSINEEIPVEVISGDNANYCYVRFIGSITALASNESDYYAYYNNPTAVDPGNSITKPEMIENFTTNPGSDKWAYEKTDETTTPPGTGPSISGESEFSSYSEISISDNTRYSTAAVARYYYATQHFKFTVPDKTTAFNNFSIKWEGYGDQTTSYLYIYSYSSANWELVGSGASTTADNTISATYTNYDSYVDSNGYVHLVAQSQRTSQPNTAYLFTDYVEMRVFYNSTSSSLMGTENSWINRTSGSSEEDGIFKSTWRTNSETGWYTASSLSAKAGYNSNFAFKHFEIIPDTTTPKISLLEPFNQTWNNNGSITISYLPTDNSHNLSECSLYINNKFNQTNSSIIDNQTSYFYLDNLNSGGFIYYVNCTDSSSNEGKSEEKIFYVDKIKPTIILKTPIEALNSSSSDVNFNFSVYDNMDTELVCNLTIDSNIVEPYINIANNSFKNFTETLSYGSHSWNVTCWDNASNENTSIRRNLFVDLIDPQVTLILPKDGDYTNNKTVTFRFNVTDDAPSKCELYTNKTSLWEKNQTITPINNSINSFSPININDGSYIWQVYCNDTAGNKAGAVANSTLTIDTVEPNVEFSINSTKSGSHLNQNWIYAEVNVTEAHEKNITFYLYNSSLIDEATELPGTYYHNFTGLSDGTYWINVTARDLAGNENTTNLTEVVLDTQKPVVSLISPGNHDWLNYTNITLKYIPEDTFLDSCVLYTNKSGVFKRNATESSVISGEEYNFTIIFNESTIIWNVICNDSAGNKASAPLNYTVNIDITNPTISFISPVPNENLSENFFVINVSHTEINPQIIMLNFSGTLYVKNYSGSYTNFSLTGISDGVHSYYAWLNDSAGNSNQTETRNITIDTNGPGINLTKPENDTWSNTNNNYFNFTAQDSLLPINSCRLIIQNKVNDTKGYNSKTIDSFFNTSLSSGDYNWSINCSDSVGNENHSETRLLKVDLTDPTISVESTNATRLNITKYICLNATATDTYSGINTVWGIILLPNSLTEKVFLYDDGNGCDKVSGDNVYSASYQVLQVGVYNWTQTYANDTASNEFSKTTGIIWNSTSIGTLTVNLSSPLNNFEINESEPNRNFTYTQSCTVVCDDKPQNCSNVYLYAQYNYSTASDITTSSVYLINNESNYFCGNLTAGGSSCNHTFTIRTSTDSGDSKWKIWCRAESDVVGSYTSSESTNLTINDHPIPQFYYPTNQTWLHGTENLNASLSTDDQAISLYAFYLDNNSGFSSPSLLCNKSQNNCTFNTLTQGQCNEENNNCFLKLKVTDSNGLVNETYITIGIDNKNPRITLNNPANNHWSDNKTIKFNFTPTDVNLDVCSLYIDSSWNKTLNNPISGIPNIISQNISDGSHTWNIYCNDTEPNAGFNESDYTFNIDTQNPKINYSSGTDLNDTWINKNWIYVNVTYSDANIANITFYLYDNSSTLLNETTLGDGNTSINFTIDQLAYRYYFNVTVRDKSGRKNSTPTRFVKIDHYAPVSRLDLPLNNTIIYSNITIVNATVNDTGLGVQTVSFSYKENASDTWHTICQDTSQPYECNWDVSSLNEGNNYSVRVYAEDIVNNVGTANIHYQIGIDHLSPNLAIISPKNNTRSLYGNVTFLFNVTDTVSGIKNCSLILNNLINQTKYNLPQNQTNNFTLQSLGIDNYNWSIICYDDGSHSTQSGTFNLSVKPDTEPPVLTLVSPIQNFNFTTDNPQFKYNVSDALTEVKNCTLIINGKVNQTQDYPSETSTNTFIIYRIADGNYTWQINCTDNSIGYYNKVSSEIRNFSVTKTTNLKASLKLNGNSFEKGENIYYTVNVTDKLNNKIDAQTNISIVNTSTKIPWWNPHYTYRKNINITNLWKNISGNYTINITLDTETLISNNKMLVNGTDLRIAYFNNVTNRWTELDRLISNINTTSTLIKFRTQANLIYGESSYDYWVYYGNNASSNPPENKSNIFLYYDNFDVNSTADYSLGPAFDNSNEDSDNNLNWNSGGYMDYNATANYGKSMRIENRKIKDMVIEIDQYVKDWRSPFANLEIATLVNGSTYYYFSFSTNIYNSVIGRYVDGSKTELATGSNNNTKDTWHSLKLLTKQDSTSTYLESYADGVLIANATDTSGRISNAGGFGFGAFQLEGRWDNIKVYSYTTNITGTVLNNEEHEIDWTSGSTGNDGGILMHTNSFNYSLGTYTAILLASNPNYYNGVNQTSFTIVQDTTPPIINLTNPVNNGWSISNTIFKFIPKDNSFHIKNCSLYLNGVFNKSISNITNNATNIISVNGMSGGNYNWFVNCSDYSGNENKSQVFNLLIDTLGPSIKLNTPINDTNLTSSSVTFNYSVSDNSGENITCNLTYNNVFIRTNITVINGSSDSYFYQNITSGQNYWNVTCKDPAGNVNTSVSYLITKIIPPENIKIYLSDDNKSVRINWSEVDGAKKYNIFITSNYSNGFPTNPNVTISDNNYTDLTSNQTTQRYYRIGASRGDANSTSNRTFGKYEREINSGWELISTPLNLSYNVLGTFSSHKNPFPVNPSNNINSIWSYKTSESLWQRVDWSPSGWQQVTGSEDFTTIEPNTGYWLETNSQGTLIFLGEVLTKNNTKSLETNWNLAGWTSIQIVNLPNSTEPPTYPIQVSPSNSISRIYRYVNGSFEMTNHFANFGWYPAFNTLNFTKLNPTYGYYFKSLSIANWTVTPWKN